MGRQNHTYSSSVLYSIVLAGAFSFHPGDRREVCFSHFDSLIALGLTSYLTLAIFDWLTGLVQAVRSLTGRLEILRKGAKTQIRTAAFRDITSLPVCVFDVLQLGWRENLLSDWGPIA